MRVRFTFKHMLPSKEFKDIAESKFANLMRRFHAYTRKIRVTVDTDGPFKRMHAFLITQNGREVEASVRGQNEFSLIDELVQKLDGQMRRTKDRWTASKHKIGMRHGPKGELQKELSARFWGSHPSRDSAPIDAGDILKLPPHLWGPVPADRAS